MLRAAKLTLEAAMEPERTAKAVLGAYRANAGHHGRTAKALNVTRAVLARVVDGLGLGEQVQALRRRTVAQRHVLYGNAVRKGLDRARAAGAVLGRPLGSTKKSLASRRATY
jgi:hypothetical protein